ncbi:septum site-determining protein MinC [Acetivibrio clariflavus]|uniref:Probable septum site-determining protein MinC n=1 Tax=Acetivibrio clariflavus (strain DSM 19732 / NBRC 101661 / EBR45) TaxID=720554 RepID=G8LY60_ACECE|nr:septum site-determining protein MinC [Acetivibrio clariflavus]AEV67791.1 septum site-determining protein MinC [Acetivibrio clariflavus DSM 19732]
MNEGSVIFKGSLNCLTIIMKEEIEFDEILNQIEEKIISAGKFFKGAKLKVKYRGKKLSFEEEEKVFQLLQSKSGAQITGIEMDMEEPPKAEVEPIPQPHAKIRMSNFYFKGLEEGITKFYRGTVRSGQLINFDGNLVVIGDVNPGAELIATGNVVVMGSLRGIVHAGANGNKQAIVVALNLQPTQLRIADIITRSPDEKDNSGQFIPEIAYVKDDMVYIERYLPAR